MKASKNSKTNINNIIIIVTIILIFLALFIASMVKNREIPNPVGTVGNTAGNLNNQGLFCEYNGVVYFSNINDNGYLYSMNPDETNLKKLNESTVQNILAGGTSLYYFQTQSSLESGLGSFSPSCSFIRCDLKGGNSVSITYDVVVTGQLIDDYLYLLTAGKTTPRFYKIKTDKSETVELAKYQISPACVNDGTIYYAGTTTDHYLHSLNTATDVSQEIWDGNLAYPVWYDGYIYFLDISGNYCLSRYSLAQGTVEVLTNERVDLFNIQNGYIYYQTVSLDDPQLKMMHTDGSNQETVALGTYTHINVTSQYVYFQKFGVDDTIYHVPVGTTYSSIWSNP